MGAFYETLPPSLITWLLQQKVFWIASAPLAGDGHVNVSPKGISDKGGPFFGVIKETKNGEVVDVKEENKNERGEGEEQDGKAAEDIVIRKFWYMDLTGSGIETTSHLHEPGNGRITVMFNAFEGPPRILRIFGKGMSSHVMLCYGQHSFYLLTLVVRPHPEQRARQSTLGVATRSWRRTAQNRIPSQHRQT